MQIVERRREGRVGRIYREYPLEEIPWHAEGPAEYFTDLLKKVKIGLALEINVGNSSNILFSIKSVSLPKPS